VLQGRQALALPPDQGPELVALALVAEDVEAARLAGLDVDAGGEADVRKELLEDHLAGGQRLGRRLGGLELGALGCDRAASGNDLGLLAGGQVRAAAAGPVVVAPRSAVVAAGSILTAGSILGSRLAGPLVRCGGGRLAGRARPAVISAAAVVAAGATVTVAAAEAAVVAAGATVTVAAAEAAVVATAKASIPVAVAVTWR